MANAHRILSDLYRGESETLNGFAAGLSLLALSITVSFVPVSKLPPVPFLQLLLGNYALMVASGMSAGCILLVRSTLSYSGERMHPMMLFALAALASAAASYAAAGYAAGYYSGAVSASPLNPSVMLAIALSGASIFVMAHTARVLFIHRFSSPAPAAAEQRS